MGAINYLAGSAPGVAQQGYTGFPGPRIAGFSPDQLNAFNQVRATQGSYVPGLAGAYQQTALAGRQLPDVNLGQYMSPYQQAVTDIAKREAIRQDELAQQGRNASAVAAGAFGGSRQGLVEAEAARNLQQQLGDIQALGSQSAYDRAVQALTADRAAALGAGRQFGELAGQTQQLGLRDIAALENIGRTQQGQEQAGLDMTYQDFLTQREWPKTQLGWLSNVLRGNQLPTTTTTTAPGPSMLGQLGGLGLAATGLIGGTGGFGSSGWLTKLLNFKHGGPVKRRYADGGLISLSLPELRDLQTRMELSGRDSRPIRVEIDRRVREGVEGRARPAGSVLPFITRGLSELARPDFVPFSPTAREEEFLRRSLPLPQNADLRGGVPSMPENVDLRGGLPYSRPLPRNVDLRGGLPAPVGLEATPEAMQNVDTRGGIAGEVDRDLEGTRGQLPTPPAEAASDFWSKAALPMTAAGFRMLASKPGETALGALGAGGLEGIKAMQDAKIAALRERQTASEEKKTGIAEREVARKEREDTGTLAYRNRVADIEEKYNAGRIDYYKAQEELARANAEYLRTAKTEEAKTRAEGRIEALEQKREMDLTRRDQVASQEYTRVFTKAEEANLGPLDPAQKFKLDLDFVKRHRGSRYADNMRESMKNEAEVTAEIRRSKAAKQFAKDPKRLEEETKKIDDALKFTLKQIGE